MFDLSNKLIIVTGAARGNGKGIADGLYKYGAEIIAIDLSFYNNQDKNYLNIIGDVSDLSTIKKVLKLCKKKGKDLVLINNAGVSIPSEDGSFSIENWNKTMLINLTAPYLWIEAFSKIMIQKNNGSVINITSLSSERGFPNNPAYVASKGGLKMLTKAYAKDLGKYNIRLNNVGPGYFKTDMTRKSYENSVLRKERTNHTLIKRWGSPNDLVGICAYLSSDLSSYVTGQDFYIDGGWLANGLNN